MLGILILAHVLSQNRKLIIINQLSQSTLINNNKMENMILNHFLADVIGSSVRGADMIGHNVHATDLYGCYYDYYGQY